MHCSETTSQFPAQTLTEKCPELTTYSNQKLKSLLFWEFLTSENKRQGGRRCHGFFRSSTPHKPLVTVITVVYNGVAVLEKTILNVLKQSYDNIEFIIIDGGSQDGTVEIIQKYEQYIDYWISAKDLGIYDAMNRGIALATGEWLSFMNADDYFYASDTVEKLFSSIILNSNIAIIYGDYQVRYSNKTRIALAHKIEKIWKGPPFSHQSCFIRKQFHVLYPYNIQTKIVADFEFFYQIMLRHHLNSFLQVQQIIASISAGGVSDVKRVQSLVGHWNVVEKTTLVNFFYIYRILSEMFKSVVKKVIN